MTDQTTTLDQIHQVYLDTIRAAMLPAVLGDSNAVMNTYAGGLDDIHGIVVKALAEEKTEEPKEEAAPEQSESPQDDFLQDLFAGLSANRNIFDTVSKIFEQKIDIKDDSEQKKGETSPSVTDLLDNLFGPRKNDGRS